MTGTEVQGQGKRSEGEEMLEKMLEEAYQLGLIAGGEENCLKGLEEATLSGLSEEERAWEIFGRGC